MPAQRQRLTVTLLATFLCAVAAATSWAAEAEKKPEEKITYVDHVQPIFREHCFICHNQGKATNDLALDSYERLMQGGASGTAIEPGDPGGSYLWSLVSHQDQPNMPPNQDKLPDAKLAMIEKWITGGALKDSGSVAKIKKKASLDLSVGVGAGKPEGPAAMPQGLSQRPVVYTEKPGPTIAIASSPWAPLVAVAGQHQIVLYNSDTAEQLGVLPFAEGIPYVLKFSRSGTLLLAGGGRGASRGLVVGFDVRTGERAFEVGDELDAVLAADITADHKLVALGGPQRLVRVYSTEDGSLVYQITKHTDWVLSVAFSPDGVLLATADRAGGLLVWEALTGREFYDLAGHRGAVTDVSWRADSNVLASASEDGTIKLWGMEEGTNIKSFNAHGGGVLGLEFTHDGRMVSCGRDRLAKAWKPDGSQLRAFESFPDIAMAVTFDHDGGQVIAGDYSGQIRAWKTEDGKQAATLASNPPTLAMIAEAALAKAAEARKAAEKAAAELAEATAKMSQAKGDAETAELQKTMIEKAVANQLAAAAAEEAQAAADKAVAQRDAAAREE